LINESWAHLLNADRAIRESSESLSNVTLERLPHSRKQFGRMTFTDAGMKIHESEKHWPNPYSPIRETVELLSNVTDASFPH
jgi:hypothetical protein